MNRASRCDWRPILAILGPNQMRWFNRQLGLCQSIAGVSLLVLGACSQANEAHQSPSDTETEVAATSGSGGKPEDGATQAPAEPPELNSPRPPETDAEKRLDETLQRLGDGFEGEIGIAILDHETGWAAQYKGLRYLPQQSVSKLWVAITFLDQVDRGELDLSEEVTLEKDDLTVFYQPIRTLILRNDGYTTTLGDLLERAITHSDNTANDFLLRRVGGPDAVRRMFARKELGGIKFGPGEQALQSEIAGLQWKDEYSIGPAFLNARGELPVEERREAFEDYLNDPMDGALALGITRALGKLENGQLLSPSSTKRMLRLMDRSTTGERRLTGGLPTGWSIAHKTGTGQILEGVQAGYNDVGLLDTPDGETYSIAVLIGRTDRPRAERRRLMHNTVDALAVYHRNSQP